MLPYQTKWVYYHRAANFQGHQHISSTVEALNSALKNSMVAQVRPNMAIDKSVENQLKQVDSKKRKAEL
jgi:hypothetical protein